MSQITRCPFCKTQFKVVADQLRISEGWVRCGQCKQVFDATENLQLVSDAPPNAPPDTAPEVAPNPVPSAPPPDAAPAPPPSPSPSPKGYELPSARLPELDSEWFDASDLDFGAMPKSGKTPVPVAPAPLAPSVPSVPSVPPVSAAPKPAPKPPQPPERGRKEPQFAPTFAPISNKSPSFLPPREGERQEPYLSPDLVSPPASPTPVAGQEAPSFVRAAQRKSFWSGNGMLMGLLAASILLLCGMVLQVLFHQRNVLAATHPGWRPALQAMCAPLRCKVGGHRHIASVAIESSSFAKAKGDDYQFGITLKNRLDMALEMPAVELTLTDLNDQPVVRRVLTPQDLHAPPELAAHGEWSGSLVVRLSTGGSMLASGYRVLAFYP